MLFINFEFLICKSAKMKWIIVFLIIALGAAVLGFSSLEGTAASIAQVIFYIFIVLFIVALIRNFSK